MWSTASSQHHGSMVQAWVAHFVTPLKRRQGVSDRQVTNQKLQKKHKSPSKHHHHGMLKGTIQ